MEEGLGGRTTTLDDPISPHSLNGYKYLLPCINSHAPLDMDIIMLGSNDLKNYYSMSAAAIAKGNELLAGTVMSSRTGPEGKAPEVLLISPAAPEIDMEKSFIRDFFDPESTAEKCRRLPGLIKETAEILGCHYLNADDLAEISPLDNIHFTAAGHKKLARGVYRKILDIYAGEKGGAE